MQPRVRIAPSPTGNIHIGNLRTMLYDFLYARRHGGSVILRIEDTDHSREKVGSIESIHHTLSWAGLIPDEGPTADGGEIGEYGPYIQSQRLDIYQTYIDKLLAINQAYWCVCTEEELTQKRTNHIQYHQKIGYDGTCREKKLAHGLVVRMKVPHDGTTTFIDLIRGEITIQNSDVDDQVIKKSDGYPTYHLAVVVDDHLMKISHVFRGEEWIASTPKHLLLYQAFGWNPPLFAHMPLLLNTDRTKLSKRQGAVSAEDFIAHGYVKEALINFLALQGFNPRADQELYSIEELIGSFDISKVNKSGSVVNFEKLDWMQAHYVKTMEISELVRRAVPFMKQHANDKRISQLVKMVQDRLVRLEDIEPMIAFIFEVPHFSPELLVWKKSDSAQCRRIIDQLITYLSGLDSDVYSDELVFEAHLKQWILDCALKNGEVLWPLRVALSGLEHSPPPFIIASILGKEEVLRRLGYAKGVL